MKPNLWVLAVAVALCAVSLRAAENETGGIGIALETGTNDQGPRIARVFPQTPAAKAGLTAGSVLQGIGDTSTAGKSLSDCVALIRGPVGSKLTLNVLDPKSGATRKLEVTREKVSAPAKGRLGDAAAPLAIKEWIQGGPVDVKDGKAIYVVEFWATWCGPCRTSIPHLTALQKRLKDKGVVIIGISSEDPATVKPFVKKMGAQMDYVVACDDSRQTFAGYMQPYGYNGIPTAFVVGKDGRVLWHGHPMAGLDKALEKILARQP